MSRIDKLALLLSFLAVVTAYLVASRVFENIPHLEDEIAYVWQATIMTEGKATIPTPIEPKKFLIPFVVDYEGQRFGKYPLGWPALLSVGVKLGVREWINPLLAGLAVWLTYILGKKLMGELVGGLAALLTVTSPFFLLNVGSLLSHAWGLVLSLGFVIAWWDMTENGRGEEEKKRKGEGMKWLAAVTAGLTLGVFVITRPFSAIGVAIPFGVHGLYLLAKSPQARWRVLSVGLIAATVGLLLPLWQAVATGDPALNPYTLWWAYDRVGFGPGVGVIESGHTLRQGWINTKRSLWVAYSDLFGWPMLSWIFLPFGIWASRRNWKMLLTGSVVLSLLVLHLAYWIGAWLFGPRYQFEGLFSLTLLSAAGIVWLAGWLTPVSAFTPKETSPSVETETGSYITRTLRLRKTSAQDAAPNWGKFRALGMTALIAVLLAGNLIFYLPNRFNFMQGLYGISKARMEPFLTSEAQALTPAVIIVHTDHWTDYGTLLELEDPFLTSPFIFTFGDKSTFPRILQVTFPERAIYHYYPDHEPYKFFTDRVPELRP